MDEVDVDARRFYERHGFSNTEPGGTDRMLYYERELERPAASVRRRRGTWRPSAESGVGPLAQLVEQGTFNPKVAGSIPARPIVR